MKLSILVDGDGEDVGVGVGIFRCIGCEGGHGCGVYGVVYFTLGHSEREFQSLHLRVLL